MPAPRPYPARQRPKGPRRRGTTVLAGLAVMLTAGCGVVPRSDASGTDQPPPVDADSTRSSRSSAHAAAGIAERVTDAPTDTITSTDLDQLEPRRDPDGPDHAAVAVILDGLAAEGLLVTALDTDLIAGGSRQATVVVTIAHSPGHGHPIQSRYELHLAASPDGWVLTGHAEQR